MPPPLFASALIPHALGYVREHGGDAGALMKRFKLSPEELEASVTLPTESFRDFMEAAAEELDDPLFGLHVAKTMKRGAYELFEFALRSAPNGAAVLGVVDQFGDQLNPAVRFSVERVPTEVRIHHRVKKGGTTVGRQGNIFTVARLLIIARELFDDALSPSRVWMDHDEPAISTELREFFGNAELLFGRSTNGMAFHPSILETPVRGADPALHAVLTRHQKATRPAASPDSPEQTFREQVTTAIAKLLPEGNVTVDRVAKRLHVSDRTLQRRLQEEGLNFASLQEEVRADLAKALLSDPADLALSEIAQQVGYTDAAAFARAFKRWTGITPGTFRAKRAENLA